jgi:glycosyltransferase involved in cell wall biosynthesis
MRVLIVHDESIDGGYGAESYVRRLVAGLRLVGDEVEVVAGEVRHDGVNRLFDLWDPGARRLVQERSQRFSPDVVHHHNISRELSASVLTAAPAVPNVMTVHDLRLLGAREHAALTPRGLSERITTQTVRRTAKRRLTATMGVSDRVSSELQRHGFPSVRTVRVPVAAPVKPPRAVASCRDVAILARLAPDKGVDVAIDAFRAASYGSDRDCRLFIAGDGPSRAALQRRAAGLGARVNFLGRLAEHDVSSLLGRVRVVMVASQPTRRPEGSSLAMVEAAAHGRPVVATDDPAVREVAAELGGALVVPALGVDELGDALGRLLADDDLATGIGERGRVNAVRLHSIAAVADATRAVYREAIAAGARRGRA